MPEFAEKVRFEDARAIKATDKALWVEIDGDRYWVPQSQIDDDSDVWKPGQSGTLVVSEWWAEKLGLA
jgi:hypothetical protein